MSDLGACPICAEVVTTRQSFDLQRQAGRNVYVHRDCLNAESNSEIPNPR